MQAAGGCSDLHECDFLPDCVSVTFSILDILTVASKFKCTFKEQIKLLIALKFPEPFSVIFMKCMFYGDFKLNITKDT